MYRNALVTVDGTGVSEAALREVSKVVERDGRVTILEVVESPGELMAAVATPEPVLIDTTGIDAVVQSTRAAADANLRDAQTRLEADGLTNVETLMLEGHAGDQIVDEAKRRGCDVVVMATHGRGGLERIMVGSVADHVVRHLDDVAVLLVHPAAA
jgi:nucleotide-binding universal stress UspA family protein